MAHFAKIENNIVVDIHVVDNINLLDENGIEQEQIGIDYLKSLWGDLRFLQCSYNGNMRKRYPGIGYSYDETNNVFLTPKPFASWILNENFDWEAPVSMPVVEFPQGVSWNEETLNWDIIELPANLS
jgi:hypothetical protein